MKKALRAGNAAISGLGGAAVSVVAFVAAQLLFGFAWGVVCRAVLDCSMSGFANPWVLVPGGVVSLLIAVYIGWLAGRKMYRSLQGAVGDIRT
ncbi:MAG: hypothetical protein OXL38_06490 [Gammaproteobacteria bacterium]|nr:hypothetical protein [Gammaproteobacteria bacterium]